MSTWKARNDCQDHRTGTRQSAAQKWSYDKKTPICGTVECTHPALRQDEARNPSLREDRRLHGPEAPQTVIAEHVDTFQILRQEMEVAMGLTGVIAVTHVSALSRSALVDDGVGYLHNA
ncbi:MAG: hypothetical protein ABSC00_05385 [Acidimicrobiales bacterium]